MYNSNWMTSSDGKVISGGKKFFESDLGSDDAGRFIGTEPKLFEREQLTSSLDDEEDEERPILFDPSREE